MTFELTREIVSQPYLGKEVRYPGAASREKHVPPPSQGGCKESFSLIASDVRSTYTLLFFLAIDEPGIGG